MNRIITINLGGYALSIEEDAYDLLRDYLRKLEVHFASTPNGREIVSDIEARLAEMFNERIEHGKAFISIADVEEVIDQMGNPSDLDEETEHTEATYVRKKLFRDTQNGIFGGVSSGLAVYFNTDVVWIRVIWLLLFFFGGIGFVPYIILWIIIPSARTKADRLAMEGKSPNLRNFQDAFVEEAERVAGQWRERSERNRWGEKVRSLMQALMEVLRGFFKFLAGLIGIALIAAGVALLFGFTFGKIYMETNVLPFTALPSILGLERWSFWMQISLLVVVLIPLILLVVSIARFLLGTRPLPLSARKGLGVFWFIGIASLAGMLIYTSMQFSSQESIVLKRQLSGADTLLVKLNPLSEGGSDRKIRFGEVKLDIEPTEGDEVMLWLEKSSKGPNSASALELAGDIEDGFTYEQGVLTLPTEIRVKKNTAFRKQQMRYILKVPIGQRIILHKRCESILNRADNLNDLWSRSLAGHQLLMKKEGLECTDCEREQKADAQNQFNKIEIDGAFKVFFRQGETEHFELKSEAFENDVVQSIQDGLLQVRFKTDLPLKDRLGLLKDRPEIYISAPHIEQIRLIGANEAEINGLTGDLLEINVEGASILDARGLELKILDIELEGAGELTLEGKAEKLLLTQEGAADVSAWSFETREAILELGGGSTCRLNVQESLTGKASGASSVQYRGNPVVSMNTSGASKLEQKND